MKIINRIRIGLASARTDLAEAYRPILRGFLKVACVYYAFMLLAHAATRPYAQFAAMGAASLAAVITAAVGVRYLREPRSPLALDLTALAIDAAVLFNVWVALQVEFDAGKLAYFPIMAMIFAFSGVSLRVAVPCIIAAIAVMVIEIRENAPTMLHGYGFIALASAVCAITVSTYLRHAILIAMRAKADAEVRLVEAERLGDLARTQSHTDELTGISNRRAFFEELLAKGEGAIAPHHAALLLIDIDSFKAINDVYGYAMGDELLVATGRRLRDLLPGDAFIARIGGDEFNILLPAAFGPVEIDPFCDGLTASLRESFLIMGRKIQISATIGYATASSDISASQLLEHAGYALQYAKRTARGHALGFRDAHEREMRRRFSISQALRMADLSQELEIVIQPQVDITTSCVVGGEVLARWTSGSLGPVDTGQFIQAAEESGLITEVTMVVLDKALRALASWRVLVPISINLSAQDVLADRIVERISALVERSGVPAAMIHFEVTESAMFADGLLARTNLQALAKMGHRIALDDFGTGYSNFSYLRELPVSRLKIDRSFVSDISNPTSEGMARALVDICQLLGLDCTIEGVETPEQMEFVSRIGATVVQGYLTGKPTTPDAVEKRLTKEQDRYLS